MAVFKKVLTVTGLSQYNFGEVEKSIREKVEVNLKQDPSNRYDENATGVFFRGDQIGWIKKSENGFISRVLRVQPNHSKIYMASVIRYTKAQPIWKSILNIEISVEVPGSLVGEATNDGWVREASASTTVNWTDEYEQVWREQTTVNTVYNSNNIIDISNIPFNKTTKEITIMAKIADTNKQVATQAAFMEASRVLLNQATKMVAKQAPMFVKGYVDTPFGKLALANAMVMAVNQFRPNDARLVRLANAALGQAYQEVYKSFDIETFIEGFLDNATIKNALEAAGGVDAE